MFVDYVTILVLMTLCDFSFLVYMTHIMKFWSRDLARDVRAGVEVQELIQ